MKKSLCLMLVVSLMLAIGCSVSATVLFSDNWSDLTVQGPAFAASGVDWSIENGGFSADAATPPGSFFLPQSGRLMFSPNDTYLSPSRISVNFGSSAANTPVEARFKLHQTNAGVSGYRFAFGLKDTASGKYYNEEATTYSTYYGTSGFSVHNSWGDGPGTAGQCLSTGQWDYLKMRFDPAAGAITIWQAIDSVSTKSYDDASLTYTMVATWSNWAGLTSVDQFYLNGQGGLSWMVDDVEIGGQLEAPVLEVATPVFSPGGGQYTSPQNVVITCATPGATIHYTTDGSEPTETNGTAIASGASVLVDHPLTLKARAFVAGYSPSSLNSSYYLFAIVLDDWTDLTVEGPAFAASGADWSIENGGFSADAATPPGSFLLPQSGRLMFSPNDTYLSPSRISVNFGSSSANTPVEARFKLHQTNAGIAGYRFAFGLKDTASGKYYHEEATTVNNYYGTSGFSIHNSWGEGAGTAGQCLSAGQWDYLKMRFDPAAGAITLWQAIDTVSTKAYDDASLTYTMVATWSNWQGGTSVDQFYLNGQGGFSWMADDVEIYAISSAYIAQVTAPVLTPGGGQYTGPQNVVITCETPGATIHYTTDGSEPTESSPTVADGGTVTVAPGTTLMAKAWKTGMQPSSIASATYTALNRPQTISYGTAVVDGDLADWAGAQWAPLDQLVDNPAGLNAYDITDAAYTARWTADKVYVAVKVRDTKPNLLDDYTAWDAKDDVEIFIHTTGTGAVDYSSNNPANFQVPAQQYMIWVQPSGNTVGTGLNGGDTPTAGTGAQIAGRYVPVAGEEGGWLYYEAAIVSYKSLNLSNPVASEVSPLSAGQVIGLDVWATTNDGGSYRPSIWNSRGYTGVKGESGVGGLFADYSKIGLHLLASAETPTSGTIADVKGQDDNTLVSTTGRVTAVFGDVFYVESTDRSSGIRVEKAGHGVAAGWSVTVTGRMATITDTGERYISATTVSGSMSTELTPLGMTNKSLGGSGVTDGSGMNSIGLLIKTTGEVGEKGTGWFMIDDGSGVSVKVFGTAPAGTPYVAVTGASSCEKDGSGNIQRVIYATQIQEM